MIAKERSFGSAIEKLTEPQTIIVDVEDIMPGIPESSRSWWNWDTYIETWKIIDKNPDTPIEQLPLYKAMKKHYSAINGKRLRFELDLLGLKNGDRDAVAKGWVKRHVKLYKDIKRNGFDENRKKRIRVFKGRTAEDKVVVVLRDGHNRVSMIKHLGEPKRIKVVLV